MRRILVVGDDLHIRLAMRAWLKRYGFRVARSQIPTIRPATRWRLGATRCQRKPFGAATLLGAIDACLLEAEPRRRYAATLAAAADTLSQQQAGTPSSEKSKGVVTGRSISTPPRKGVASSAIVRANV